MSIQYTRKIPFSYDRFPRCSEKLLIRWSWHCFRYNDPCRCGASHLCSKMRHDSYQFYRERNESRVCKLSDNVPPTRHVTIVHPIGKKFFDKIGDFLFQFYVKTALKIDSQSEESHNSTPMYQAVVKDFSGDSSVNCFWFVTLSVHTDIYERIQLDQIFPSSSACQFNNSLSQCKLCTPCDNFIDKQTSPRDCEQLINFVCQHLEYKWLSNIYRWIFKKNVWYIDPSPPPLLKVRKDIFTHSLNVSLAVPSQHLLDILKLWNKLLMIYWQTLFQCDSFDCT